MLRLILILFIHVIDTQRDIAGKKTEGRLCYSIRRQDLKT